MNYRIYITSNGKYGVPPKNHHQFLETLLRARHRAWPFPYTFLLNSHYSFVMNYLEIVIIISILSGDETKAEKGRDLPEVTELVLVQNQDENSPSFTLSWPGITVSL